MRKILLSISIVLSYIFIILYFPRLRYHFSLNLEIIKLIISLLFIIVLISTRQLSFNQLKGTTSSRRKEWTTYPLIFAGILFAAWFGFYILYYGIDYLRIPSASHFFNTTLVLVGTVVFEEVLARAFLTNTLLNVWGRKTRTVGCVAVFCGVLFGVLHFFNYGVFNYLSVSQSIFASLTGIYLCLAFIMTNSVFEAIIIHTLFNFSSYLNLLIFNTDAFPDESLLFASNVVFTIIFALSIPLLFISIKRMKTQKNEILH